MERVGLYHPNDTNWPRILGGRMNIYSGTADPVNTEVPKGQWILYKNTTSGEIRWWINDDGTMKKSAAFT
jgi:hypothetical protein